MAAVFAAINAGGDSGSSATSAFKLKTVTKDMKAKNMKDAPVLAPKEHKESKPKKSAAKEEKKPARLELDKGTWFCENYEGEQINIPDVQMKQSVYVLRCKNCQVTIPDKCKSIQVDSCLKVEVTFSSVVSTFEIVNSQRCKVTVIENVPSVAIDKTAGFSLILQAGAVTAPPDIVTSNVSELNLVVPGATPEADPIEMALPEQYITKYDHATKKIVTEPVHHGG